MKTPFLGSSYQSLSGNLAYHRLINLYPEIVETKDGKEVAGFYRAPGLIQLLETGNGPVRGLFVLGPFLYAVIGDGFYQISSGTFAATLKGSLLTRTGPVSMQINNNQQMLIVDGVKAYGWDLPSGTYQQISLPFVGHGPVMASYQDGFFLINESGTQQWWQSGLNDVFTWSGLNFSSADASPDNISGLIDLNREVWLFGSNGCEVWVNAGTAGFAFARLQGVYIEQGLVAPYSLAKSVDSVFWLGGSLLGQGAVWKSNGYRPQRISTHAVEAAILTYRSISDAVAYTYEEIGHLFYVISFPSASRTWVYDVTTEMWHERAGFAAGQFTRHWSNCHAFFGGQHIVGDYRKGIVYQMKIGAYTDAESPQKWLRAWQTFPVAQCPEGRTKFGSLRVEAQTGVGNAVAPGENPQVMLRYSDSDGEAWSSEKWADLGRIGERKVSLMWRRLGASKKRGTNRIWEISGVDPVFISLVSADVSATPLR